MKILPDAIIPPEKTRYLLTPRSKNDKSSFLTSLGFSFDAPQALEAAIRRHASEEEAVMDEQDVYGDHFALIGTLFGPAGGRLMRSIWVRRTGETSLRFVTLYPAKEKP